MAHKLLLADDSVTIQRVIELTFADEDVEVTTVGDGQLAIERLDADPPDIVLADVDMPKRDGYEVAAYIKSRPTLAHIPVVLLTGAFEPIDQARAVAAGSSDVLAKPFEPQMVINRVKELLGKKRAEDERDNYAAPRQPAGHPNSHPTAQSPRGGGPGAAAAVGAPAAATPQPRQAMPPKPPALEVPPQENQMSGPTAANPTLQARASQPPSLDDYFDQLDAAFSNLQPGPARPEHEEMQSEIDWPLQDSVSPAPAAQARTIVPPARVQPQPQAEQLITPPPRPPAFAPQSGASASAPSATADKSARQVPAPSAPHAPSAPVAPKVPAFAPGASASAPSGAAADKSAAKPTAPVAPLAPSAAVAPAAAPVVTEELIQQVVARVLLRLSDRVVRETVSEIVSKTAERLVQEEIERIKASGD